MIKLLLVLLISTCHAITHNLPKSGNVIEEVSMVISRSGDTLEDLSARYLISPEHIKRANPYIYWGKLNNATLILLPTAVILPKGPRSGIVVNIAEKRMYDYTTPGKVRIYSVGIGREKWPTPLGKFKITSKRHLPVWTVPRSVMKEEKEKGNILPKRVPPGPENPLGEYAMRLSHSSYLIHGTNDESNIGEKSTSGCVSMYNDDIEQLYKTARNGVTVTIVNQPVKIGMSRGKKWIEIHAQEKNKNNSLTTAKEDDMMAMILRKFKLSDAELEAVKELVSENSNLPQQLN